METIICRNCLKFCYLGNTLNASGGFEMAKMEKQEMDE